MNIRVVVLRNIELQGLGPNLVSEENYRRLRDFLRKLTASRKVFRKDLLKR